MEKGMCDRVPVFRFWTLGLHLAELNRCAAVTTSVRVQPGSLRLSAGMAGIMTGMTERTSPAAR